MTTYLYPAEIERENIVDVFQVFISSCMILAVDGLGCLSICFHCFAI